MAMELRFPLFAPAPLRPQPHRSPTEIRFSRWNNANAKKFILRERTQKELEDQIRFEKRFDAALAIAHNFNPAPPQPTTYRSIGTPSAPSSPSIPGKRSKYSKPPPNSSSVKTEHPAFKPIVRPRKIPSTEIEREDETSPQINFKVDENGVSYEMPEAPFLYQYSYTETPKLKPVKLREPLVSPFGPTTMAKPWLGRKPMSKKQLPEFDSFKLPPPQKKGVKPVQAPGPFLPGSGPKYVMSREEIMGAPLSKEEIVQLINGCKKSRRQLNMGRDGLTHNMLDNIHALWKRRRVCKIKCIGVCTVDMDNVRQQLEEKTGGKVIYSRGGVIYLFRGRNYNYKTRPRYPLMLWKPAAPVYPRLVKQVPEGLTFEEAKDMRNRGRDLIPICKLAKNGLYSDLVGNVREAFEACELVRLNCQGLNPSDFKKIGAKLQDLVPCVLLSFEREHILVWRGRDWKSCLMRSSSQIKGDDLLVSNVAISNDSNLSAASDSSSSVDCASEESVEDGEVIEAIDEANQTSHELSNVVTVNESQRLDEVDESISDESKRYVDGILLLRQEAVEKGMAIVMFDDQNLDADVVFKKAVEFAKVAPSGPVFQHMASQKSSKAQTCDESESDTESESKREYKLEPESESRVEREGNHDSGRRRREYRPRKLDGLKGSGLIVAPQGSLRVDELAKLLA